MGRNLVNKSRSAADCLHVDGVPHDAASARKYVGRDYWRRCRRLLECCSRHRCSHPLPRPSAQQCSVEIGRAGREDVIKYWNGIHGIYEDISFSKGRLQTFELNNGEVWSAYFGDLYAKGKFSKENYAIPINVWIQWENDKIIHQVDMLDSKFITAEIAAGNLN